MRVRQLGLFLLLSCLWASGQQAQQTSAFPCAPSAPGSDLGTSGPDGGASSRAEWRAKFDVLLALVENLKVDVEESFRDYSKFRTSAKIVGRGEVQEQK